MKTALSPLLAMLWMLWEQFFAPNLSVYIFQQIQCVDGWECDSQQFMNNALSVFHGMKELCVLHHNNTHKRPGTVWACQSFFFLFLFQFTAATSLLHTSSSSFFSHTRDSPPHKQFILLPMFQHSSRDRNKSTSFCKRAPVCGGVPLVFWANEQEHFPVSHHCSCFSWHQGHKAPLHHQYKTMQGVGVRWWCPLLNRQCQLACLPWPWPMDVARLCLLLWSSVRNASQTGDVCISSGNSPFSYHDN